MSHSLQLERMSRMSPGGRLPSLQRDRLLRSLVLSQLISFVLVMSPLALARAQEPTREPENVFEFMRLGPDLLRLNTMTGGAWWFELDGGKGWFQLDDSPDTAGVRVYPGRYSIQSVPSPKTAKLRRPGSAERFVALSDHETGRVWLAAVGHGNHWRLIGQSTSGASIEASVPAPKPASAAAPLEIPDAEARAPSNFTPEEARVNVESFKTALSKPIPTEFKVWATRQLALYDKELAGPVLLEALGNAEPEVVVAAIEGVNTLGYAPALPAVTRLKEHPDPTVRGAAEKALAR